jgi:hypothetical protein
MNPQVRGQVSQSSASPADRVPGKLPRPIRRLDVRGFHDALLGLGLLPLASLRAELGGGGGFDR